MEHHISISLYGQCGTTLKNCDISYIWKHVIFKPIGISIVVLMMPQTLSSACRYDFREPYELSRLYASSVIMLSAYFFFKYLKREMAVSIVSCYEGMYCRQRVCTQGQYCSVIYICCGTMPNVATSRLTGSILLLSELCSMEYDWAQMRLCRTWVWVKPQRHCT